MSQEDYYLSSHNGMAFLVRFINNRIDIVEEDSDTTLITNCTLLHDISPENEAAVADMAEKEYELLRDYTLYDLWTTETLLDDMNTVVSVGNNDATIYLIPLIENKETWEPEINDEFNDLYEFTCNIPNKENIKAHEFLDMLTYKELAKVHDNL